MHKAILYNPNIDGFAKLDSILRFIFKLIWVNFQGLNYWHRFLLLSYQLLTFTFIRSGSRYADMIEKLEQQLKELKGSVSNKFECCIEHRSIIIYHRYW